INWPYMRNAVHREVQQGHRADCLQSIAEQDDRAAVVAVGHMTGCKDEEDARREERQSREAELERRMRDGIDLPCHCNRVRLSTENHQQPRELIQAKVAREERAAYRGLSVCRRLAAIELCFLLRALGLGARSYHRRSAPTATLSHISLCWHTRGCASANGRRQLQEKPSCRLSSAVKAAELVRHQWFSVRIPLWGDSQIPPAAYHSLTAPKFSRAARN